MRKLGCVFIVLCFVMAFVAPVAGADEGDELQKPQQLSLEDAVNMALKNSETVKIQEEVTDKAWEQRERAADNVTFIPAGGYSPQAEAAYTGLLQADLNYQIQRKEIQNQKDEIILAVYDKYFQIQQLKEKIISLEKELEEVDWNKKTSWVQLHVGVLAPTSIPGIDAALQQAKAQLQSTKEELDKAYTELNRLTGMKPEDRVELKDSIPYEPLELYSDIDYDVYRAVNNSVNVWQALQNVTIQRKDLSFLSKPYDVEKHDVDIAELNVTQAKEELRKQVRLLYHDIKALEETIKAGEQGIKAFEEALRVKELNYKIGMATKGDVLSAQKELASAKQQVTELKYKHAVAVANYHKLIGREIVAGIQGM